MPISYERDDARRLITVVVTDPYGFDDILGVVDRQSADDTWGYAMLYDMHALADFGREVDSPRLAAHVTAIGRGRTRGPVGLWIVRRPDRFRVGVEYSALTSGVLELEVLLTKSQVDNWLVRCTKHPGARS